MSQSLDRLSPARPAVGLAAQLPEPPRQFRAQVEVLEDEPWPRPQGQRAVVELVFLVGPRVQAGVDAKPYVRRQPRLIAPRDEGAHADPAGLTRILRELGRKAEKLDKPGARRSVNVVVGYECNPAVQRP